MKVNVGKFGQLDSNEVLFCRSYIRSFQKIFFYNIVFRRKCSTRPSPTFVGLHYAAPILLAFLFLIFWCVWVGMLKGGKEKERGRRQLSLAIFSFSTEKLTNQPLNLLQLRITVTHQQLEKGKGNWPSVDHVFSFAKPLSQICSPFHQQTKMIRIF